MGLSFPRLSWLWLGGKEEKNGSLVNPINFLGDWGGLGLRGEGESLKFYCTNRSRKVKKKWKSREERSSSIDKEYDVVLVPSDGVCLSGSESDDSDWSIGWMEPHAPNFQSDDEADDSFAVLVPCYRHDSRQNEEELNNPFSNAVRNLPTNYYADGTKYMEKWLSSLPKESSTS